MGYYVDGYGHLTIEKVRLGDAYKALCALNDKDEIKRGGRTGGDAPDQKSPRPAGLTYHPARWFSWLDANYPDTCSDLLSILRMLGFDVEEQDAPNDDLIRWEIRYSNKTGQEELFTEALAPYVVDGEIYWSGEEGEKWREVFEEGSYKRQFAVTTYEDYRD
jgi:hypothetical protein